MRMIDANSAKSSILVVADCITIDCDWLNGYKTGLIAATEAIDEIPTIDLAPQWIPVTERLPKLIPCNAGTAYSEAVIVWTDGRKAMVAVWDGVRFLCAADYWEAWDESITHWMTLPKPPMDGGAE